MVAGGAATSMLQGVHQIVQPGLNILHLQPLRRIGNVMVRGSLRRDDGLKLPADFFADKLVTNKSPVLH
jgi:hypothetical protein